MGKYGADRQTAGDNVIRRKLIPRRISKATDAHTECLLTYLLTYSMEQSSPSEANRFSASQEILHILWNSKVHYRISRARHLSLS